MKETYLNNLSKELDSLNAANKDEVLTKFEKRYDFGLESGLSEEEIEKMLGDPSEVAKKFAEGKKTEENKTEYRRNYNLIIHTVNDSVRLIKSSDNKIHIKFDFDDYDNYNITDNDSGLKIDYYKTKYFALNRKKPGEILVELPDDIIFDLAEISTGSGNVIIEDLIKTNRTIIYTSSGNLELEDIEAKSISLTTVSGLINAKTLSSERISASTVSGKVEIERTNSKSVIIDTISGDIFVNNTDCKIKTTSVTGNILINGAEYNSFKKYVKGVFKK